MLKSPVSIRLLSLGADSSSSEDSSSSRFDESDDGGL